MAGTLQIKYPYIRINHSWGCIHFQKKLRIIEGFIYIPEKYEQGSLSHKLLVQTLLGREIANRNVSFDICTDISIEYINPEVA